MRPPVTCTLMLILLLASSGTARADPAYSFAFDRPSYDVSVGGTVDVTVYLDETLGPGDTSVLASSGVGLFSAGVQVVFNDAPQPMQPAKVLTTADIIGNPAFDDVRPEVSATSAKVSVAAFENPSVKGVQHTTNIFRVEIGKFRFQAGNLLGESTPIRATAYDPDMSTVVDGDAKPLDKPVPITEARATIQTVPEPSTFGLLVASAAFGLVLWRQRKAKS